MKRRICFLICAVMLMTASSARAGLEQDVNAKAAILIEQSTGEVLWEMNADEQLPIASVTKIMTMLLIMEQIDSGKLSYDDMVQVSENAMSYGGSTMFLEAGEELSVTDMMKGIAVASANDGTVAMAEHIAGSESSFVDMMNSRAQELGMINTHFVNTNGLDADGHYSSARDVSIMSAELLRHPDITKFTTIWTDELRGGKFQLANTNKLIRFYTGANGLKTGSTSAALCCLSASALRDDMQLIAVVLGAPTSAERFESAKAMLDYGFANYRINRLAEEGEVICEAAVINGVDETVNAVAKNEVTVLEGKSGASGGERRVYLNESITAPLSAGDVIGTMDIVNENGVAATVELCAQNDVGRRGIGMILKDIILRFI